MKSLNQKATRDRIHALYARGETSRDTNIVEFTPPLSTKALEILDDAEALLGDNLTRKTAEAILSRAIYEIALIHRPE